MSIRFGPSGNSDSFYAQGYKSTAQAPQWLCEMGLDAFEYSFGKGITLREKTGNAIGEAFARHDIAMSVHAPYYINLATADEAKREKNIDYFRSTMTAAHFLGAKRVVFHPGYPDKMKREAALECAVTLLKDVMAALESEGLLYCTLCPETMGRTSQLGSLDEVIALCRADERLIPAVDFAHLHARSQGGIKGKADFAAVLDALQNGVGEERTRNMHIHFARIEYSAAGERRHRTFADEGYGPDFEPLAELIAERTLTPVVICESRGTMAEDALAMKTMYREAVQRAGKERLR